MVVIGRNDDFQGRVFGAQRHRKSDKVITDNPNHHLQRLGDCYWFRLRRRGTDIVENIGGDLLTARKRRDEMLEAFDAGKPVPHLTTK